MKKLFCLALVATLSWSCSKVIPTKEKAIPSNGSQTVSRLAAKTVEILEHHQIDVSKLNCNSNVYWNEHVQRLAHRAAKEVADSLSVSMTKEQAHHAYRILLGYLVREVFHNLEPGNIAVTPIKGRTVTINGKEQPLLLYRSGLMFGSERENSCLKNLLDHGNVKHVINLYTGHFPFYEALDVEIAVSKDKGATHHMEKRQYREQIREPEDYVKNKAKSSRVLADIIADQILNPHGKAPEGHVLVHCGGGMHRTGMIYGVIQKCFNGADDALIESTIKKHVAYQSAEKPGGFEELNLQFVKDFDCKLLPEAEARLKAKQAK